MLLVLLNICIVGFFEAGQVQETRASFTVGSESRSEQVLYLH